MSSRPPLRLVLRDPTMPSPRITVPELSTSLAQTWDRWHPGDPPPDDLPWLDDDIDRQVRDLAWLMIEKLWDEIADIGLGTGEVVSFAMFPSPIGGYRLRLLEPVG